MTTTNPHLVADSFLELFKKTGAIQNPNGTYFSEQDEETIRNHFRFAEALFPESGVMLCPVSHVQTRFFSANFESILKFSQAELMQMNVADFFALIHPDDLPAVHQCISFMRSLMPYDPEQYRFIKHYRMKDKDGKYAIMREEKIGVKTLNNQYLQLLVLSKAAVDQKLHRVHLQVLKKVKGSFAKIDTYNPQQEKEMTPRQSDIANLIVKGFSNKEIADQLNVSIYTVKNHKQLLFKKTNVNSSIELAGYLKTVSN